ncbi:hypothetical protein SAMN05421788_101100 [Filimonas lacunae]|uniref:Uncharacterized protein n=1 Tax=Filimonas lacunae TaxID=477680 RepID=A0A173MML2_9BACT|nr:J domain-containing protein [Filimonas lacunae]BAV08641.1 hypothetical protein FLA_4688 [Filimonas lacunae]SIS59040.1 hypothetical protein SAMN05421788_101100 [Filimonas lacunae]
MTRKKLYIPEEVKADIKKHISSKYPLALEGFFSASEEEDALTGDLGGTLRIKNQRVFVKDSQIETPGEWTWSINYHKFRGRGPGATENKLGADGIFELTLQIGNRVEKKSLLFQSKISWKDDPNILREAIKLTTWREAAFVLNFTPTEYEAIDLDTIIKSRGKRPSKINFTPLDQFIGENFLECIVGDIDLRYNATTRKLFWRTNDGQYVSTKFSIPQRIAIQINAPDLDTSNSKYREIKNEDIHNFRMNTSAEEILSLENNYSPNELKKARAAKALIYHSDAHSFGDKLLDELLKVRMQEINVAHDFLKSSIKE